MANIKAGTRPAQLTYLALRRAAILAIIYIVLVFLLPANHATMRTYHLSPFDYRATLLSLSLPLMAAWIVAFAGYAKLRDYARRLDHTPEGECFDKLATGTAWLAWSLPLPAIAALLLNSLANQWAGFQAASIIITNYLNLLLPLIAFSIIGIGSRGLITHAKLKFSLASSRVIVILFLIAGVFYCYLTFQHLDLMSISSARNPYFLPLWLMVLTVIIPYLYTWFVGLLATYEITLFSRDAEGLLYRQALKLLAVGLTMIIASSIAIQYLTGVHPRAGHLVFGYQVTLNSVLHFVCGVGFALIAIGADRLKKIEEV